MFTVEEVKSIFEKALAEAVTKSSGSWGLFFGNYRSRDYPGTWPSEAAALEALGNNKKFYTARLLTPEVTSAPSAENEEIALLKARLEKTRDELDEAKEARHEAEEELRLANKRVGQDWDDYRRVKSELSMLRSQYKAQDSEATKQARAEAAQNLKAYQESEAAREALAKQVEERQKSINSMEQLRRNVRAYRNLEGRGLLSTRIAFGQMCRIVEDKD